MRQYVVVISFHVVTAVDDSELQENLRKKAAFHAEIMSGAVGRVSKFAVTTPVVSIRPTEILP